MMKVKKHYFGILLAATVLLVAGCAAGPDFEPPRIDMPAAYSTGAGSGEALADLEWWKLFDDPVLETLVTSALENNRDVRTAISRVAEAGAAMGYTRADRYPRLDLQANVATGNFSGSSRMDDTFTSAHIAPVLSWEVDFWGKYSRATESARAGMMASVYGLRALELRLVSDVVSAYYQLLLYRQQLEISRETLESRLESLHIIQMRFDEGMLPEIDLNQAQIQKETAAATIPALERMISKTENTLAILLGRFPEAMEQVGDLDGQTVPPAIPAGLPSELLERRPDVMQAMYTLQAQTARIGVAEAVRFPSISLTGLLGLSSSEMSGVTSEGAIWSAAGGLLAPLFNSGKYRQQVVIEEERTRQALLSYENTVLSAFRDVEDALVEVDTYRRQVTSVTEKLRAATNAKALSQERYDKGVTSYLEVLESDRTLFSVALEASELKQLYLNAYVKLYKALGGGWIGSVGEE
jgi:multidrug efflux system outer membrane protein